jgi:hypothetical protein
VLTLEEKVKARHHMGYTSEAQAFTFILGVPASVQTSFMIEGALDKLLPEAEPLFRKIICRLDAIEEQIDRNQENVAVEKIGEVSVNLKEFQMLLERYRYQQNALGNLLCVQPNPFDQRWGAWSGGSRINVSVG